MAETIREKLKKFPPVKMGRYTEGLNEREKAVIEKLIDACREIEPIYWEQSWSGGLALREKLAGRSADRDRLRYVKINAGPFERAREYKPFIGARTRPPGGGFYPEGLTKVEFEAYFAARPELKDSFNGPYTVIRREGRRLVAIPYHIAYAEHVVPAAKRLSEAAQIAEHAGLQRYLQSRAQGLLTDDYFQSDCDWIDLSGTPIDFVIGPFEVYEDHLMSLKAAYEGVVMVNDEVESRKLDIYMAHIERMEQNLPIADKYKTKQKGLSAPMTVVNDLYRSGELAHGYQAVAFSLPNDPRVHEVKGSKKVMHKNFLEARLQKVIIPLASKLLDRRLLSLVTPQGYFDFVVLHEIAHTLGPKYIERNGVRTTVNEALRECYPAIEEAKADVVSLYTLPALIEEGVLASEMAEQYPASYIGGLFRSVRFGTKEAHGKGEMMIFNYLTAEGAVSFDSRVKRYGIDRARFRHGVEKLARELLTIEAEGDYARAKSMLESLGVMNKDLGKELAGLKGIPIDFEPIFAWE